MALVLFAKLLQIRNVFSCIDQPRVAVSTANFMSPKYDIEYSGVQLQGSFCHLSLRRAEGFPDCSQGLFIHSISFLEVPEENIYGCIEMNTNGGNFAVVRVAVAFAIFKSAQQAC